MDRPDAEDLGDPTDHGYGESSRYAAHLDRGWSLLDRGDLVAARRSAEHAQDLRPEAPDAAVLLGAIALAESNAVESVRWYETAVELDPEYLEPYAAAAQVCLFEMGDPHKALVYCEEAAELEHIQPIEVLDIQLLAAECEIAMGDLEGARRRLDGLDEVRLLRSALAPQADDHAAAPAASDSLDSLLRFDEDGEPLEEDEQNERLQRFLHFALRLGRLWLDMKASEQAAEILRLCARRFPQDADTWYMLSEAETALGNVRTACQAALQSFRMDGQISLPEWAPAPAELHRMVVEQLSNCSDPAIREALDPPPSPVVLIHEAPSLELLLEGIDPRLPVLALSARGGGHGSDDAHAPATDERPPLTALAIYRRNLVRLARNREQFEIELRYALLDELAAFLQLDDERRAALELLPGAPASPAIGPQGSGAGHETITTPSNSAPPRLDDDSGPEERRLPPPRRRSKKMTN